MRSFISSSWSGREARDDEQLPLDSLHSEPEPLSVEPVDNPDVEPISSDSEMGIEADMLDEQLPPLPADSMIEACKHSTHLV